MYLREWEYWCEVLIAGIDIFCRVTSRGGLWRYSTPVPSMLRNFLQSDKTVTVITFFRVIGWTTLNSRRIIANYPGFNVFWYTFWNRFDLILLFWLTLIFFSFFLSLVSTSSFIPVEAALLTLHSANMWKTLPLWAGWHTGRQVPRNHNRKLLVLPSNWFRNSYVKMERERGGRGRVGGLNFAEGVVGVEDVREHRVGIWGSNRIWLIGW